jgi:MFS family permease
MSTEQRLVYRNKTFRRLWLAQTGSSLGDWFNQVALTTVILNLTHSPTAISLVLLCLDLPQALFSFLAGPFLDRYSKRALLYVSDMIRALASGFFIWGTLYHQLWAFYVGALCMGTMSSVFVPTRNAVIPLVVAQEDLTEASSWTIATSGVLAIVGAALGGIVTSLLNPALAFLINSLSFLWSACLIWMTRWEEKRHDMPHATITLSYLRELHDGLRAVVRDRIVLAFFGTSVAFALMSGPYFVIIPVLGDLTYRLGGLGIGLLYVADGCAFILSAALVDRVVGKRAQSVPRWYGAGYLIAAIFFVLLAFSSNIWVGMIALFLSQLGSGILMTLGGPLLQMATHPGTRGRVFAFSNSLETVTKQLSLFISGPALSLLGTPLLGIITGGIGCVAGIGWWLATYRSQRFPSSEDTAHQLT